MFTSYWYISWVLENCYTFLRREISLVLLYSCSSTVVSIFPITTHPCPTNPHQPPSILPSFGFVHESFIHVPWWTFTPSPRPPLSKAPAFLVAVSLFFISMYLVIFFLFVCFVNYVPLIGEIIWYLSFTTWLISLSIMLSRSIYAVVKGRSSFFLSAA